MPRPPTLLGLGLGLLLPLGCSAPSSAAPQTPPEADSEGGEAEADPDGAEADDTATYSYWRDAKPILDAKCGGCHQPDAIAPFPLTTYREVRAVAAALPNSLETESMPPWPPAADCQEYRHSRALDEADKALLLTWLAEGAPEGDPTDATATPPEPETPWSPSTTMAMPEPYVPVAMPDDYRCFLVPWEEAEPRYITGYRVEPGNRAIVHHVIMFNADASVVPQLEALEAEDPEPGYECFGGAGVQANWVGSWVPGADTTRLPEGTGIRIEPGSMMVIQMHYNTLTDDGAPDQTRVEVSVAEQVERPALSMPFTNIGWVTGTEPMTIPAGEPDVGHSFALPMDHPLFRQRLVDAGIEADDSFLLHAVGLHMHYLGKSGSLSVLREGGADDCLLDIGRWDFGWQGRYELAEPVTIDPEDQLKIACRWDNSPGNQPMVDGEVIPSADVHWGEGTTDEMCLGVLYVTGQ